MFNNNITTHQIATTLSSNGFYAYYVEDGGYGIVMANNMWEAKKKVEDAYIKHGGYSTPPKVEITIMEAGWFDDAPDVVELIDMCD